MKARQQSLHDEGWQSRAGKEGDAQKLDDVRVAEGAHKLTFPHELGRSLGFSQKWVDGFGGGAHRNDHLLHFAVGSATDIGASELDVGENERPQPWMIAEKLFSHFFTVYTEREDFLFLTGCDFRYVSVMTACGRCCLSENISRTTAARALLFVSYILIFDVYGAR